MSDMTEQMEYEKAIDYIFDMIRKGQLFVGSRLPTERAIAQELNIGRNSTREALSILHGMGMVKRVQGSGNYICEDANKTIFQILTMMLALGSITREEVCEFRRAMEKTVCMLLLDKGIPADKETEAKELLGSMRNLSDRKSDEHSPDIGKQENPALYDKRFHELLVETAQNTLLSTIMEAVMTVYQEWIVLVLKKADAQTRETLTACHEDIYKGIVDKDPGLLNASIDKHYNLIEELLIV